MENQLPAVGYTAGTKICVKAIAENQTIRSRLQRETKLPSVGYNGDLKNPFRLQQGTKLLAVVYSREPNYPM
jgi:hypothetical protein